MKKNVLGNFLEKIGDSSTENIRLMDGFLQKSDTSQGIEELDKLIDIK